MPSFSGLTHRLRIIVSALFCPSSKLPIPIEDSTYYDTARPLSVDDTTIPMANADFFSVLGGSLLADVDPRNAGLERFGSLCRRGDENKDSSEPDVGRLLYGLVRLAKPTTAIEVGVYRGAASCHIAQALKDNGGKAEYHLVDISASVLKAAKERLEEFRLDTGVIIHCGDGARLAQTRGLPKAEFIFLDADHAHGSVRRDLESFWPLLKEEGFLIIHDSILWNGVRFHVNRLARDLPGRVTTLATSGGSGISIVRRGTGSFPG
jgi:predicted O-methyltransferase YrrM